MFQKNLVFVDELGLSLLTILVVYKYLFKVEGISIAPGAEGGNLQNRFVYNTVFITNMTTQRCPPFSIDNCLNTWLCQSSSIANGLNI